MILIITEIVGVIWLLLGLIGYIRIINKNPEKLKAALDDGDAPSLDFAGAGAAFCGFFTLILSLRDESNQNFGGNDDDKQNNRT